MARKDQSTAAHSLANDPKQITPGMMIQAIPLHMEHSETLQIQKCRGLKNASNFYPKYLSTGTGRFRYIVPVPWKLCFVLPVSQLNASLLLQRAPCDSNDAAAMDAGQTNSPNQNAFFFTNTHTFIHKRACGICQAHGTQAHSSTHVHVQRGGLPMTGQ